MYVCAPPETFPAHLRLSLRLLPNDANLDINAIVGVVRQDEAVVHPVLVVGLAVVLKQLFAGLEVPGRQRDRVLTLQPSTHANTNTHTHRLVH